LVNVSKHALERFFGRLRINALDDVVRDFFIPSSRLAAPSLEVFGEEAGISVHGLGKMYETLEGACDFSSATSGAFWQIETFVPLPLGLDTGSLTRQAFECQRADLLLDSYLGDRAAEGHPSDAFGKRLRPMIWTSTASPTSRRSERPTPPRGVFGLRRAIPTASTAATYRP